MAFLSFSKPAGLKAFKTNNFDLLRIIAASQVLLLHAFEHFGLVYPGWIAVLSRFPGVPMFFVMSGFLISASLERNGELKNYFRNRILRIYPGLWCCVILSVICIYAITRIPFFHPKGLGWILAQLVGIIYTPDFLKPFSFGSYNGSLWTIPIELQFYIVLPVTYFIVSLLGKKEAVKTALILVIFLLFAFCSYYILVHYDHPDLKLETRGEKILRYTFVPHIYLFFFGVLLQRLKAHASLLIHGKGLFWLVAYLLFSYFMPDIKGVYNVVGNILLGITTISLAYTFSGIAGKVLRGNDISYGVYIYHGLIMGILYQLKYTGSYYDVAFVFITTYLLAFVSWRLIEKPAIQMKKQAFRPVSAS